MMTDDNYLAPPVDEMEGESDAGSSARSHQGPDFDQAKTEQEQIDAIEAEIDDLIKENTQPTVLQFFRDIDTNYMMPIFKRRMDEGKEVAGVDVEVEMAEEGGQVDNYFQVHHDESDYIPMK